MNEMCIYDWKGLQFECITVLIELANPSSFNVSLAGVKLTNKKQEKELITKDIYIYVCVCVDWFVLIDQM